MTRLIDLGANANFHQYDCRVLDRAVIEGQLDNLQVLFNKGADSNVVNDYGDTLLHTAALIEERNTPESIAQIRKIVQLLCDKNVPINAPNEDLQPPLHVAVDGGNLPAVKALVECGAQINVQDSAGRPALHIAIFNLGEEDSGDLIDYLLDNGADPNTLDLEGGSALHYAVLRGDPKIVERLIKAGANVNQVDSDSDTPLLDLCRNALDVTNTSADPNSSEWLTGAEEVTDNESSALLESYPPICAAAHNIPAIAQALLKAGADPNAKDALNESPLQCAVLAENIQLIRALADGGANLEETSSMKFSPLLLAILMDNGKIVKDLIDRGVNTEERNLPLPERFPGGCWEQPPEERVRQIRQKSPQRLRIDRNFLPVKWPAECRLDGNFTPLHMAAMEGKNEALEVLLGYGRTDLTAVTNNGNTALHLAIACQQVGATVLLLKAGAKTAACNKQGQRPAEMVATPAVEFLPRVRDDWFVNGAPSGAPPRIAADMAKAKTEFLANVREKLLSEDFLTPVYQPQEDSRPPPAKRQKKETCGLETALKNWNTGFCRTQCEFPLNRAF